MIHWHYFNHEVIDFDMINFLTGKNSSGKSTIIDAMQLVLLCDTSGAIFNKAASNRGNRTLIGYLRCELGDDEAGGNRYMRNDRFTSYIVLEFRDDIKRSHFCAGYCFDTFGENDYQKLFFRIDDKMPGNEFMKDGTPFTIERLREYIRAGYAAGKSYTTGVNRDFREALCGSLGGLQATRFTDLFKKAVSFNPNVDISSICERTAGTDLTALDPILRERVEALSAEGAILLDKIDISKLTGAELLANAGAGALNAISDEADSFRDRCVNLAGRLQDAREDATARRRELDREKELLEKGLYQYPKDAADLREWIEVTGGVRYAHELSSRGGAVEIAKAFPRELSRSKNA